LTGSKPDRRGGVYPRPGPDIISSEFSSASRTIFPYHSPCKNRIQYNNDHPEWFEAMIRPLHLEDFDELLQIEAQAFPKSQYDREELWLLSLKYPHTFLVTVSNQVDGYIVFSADGHIISMAVRPQKRREGIGTRLVQKVIDQCSGKSLRLEVRVSNVGAQRFYLNLDFRIKARIVGYYHDGEDAFLMERSADDTKDTH
jgi:ribosomal-protein-alanine N-acetyltransferase